MKKIAVSSLVVIFTLTLIFHLLVLTGIIPYTLVWGGRITNYSKMLTFETVSLLLNTGFLSVSLAKLGVIRIPISDKGQNIILYCMAALFLANTAGNLLSLNSLEKTIFTPITLLISILCLVATKYKTRKS